MPFIDELHGGVVHCTRAMVAVATVKHNNPTLCAGSARVKGEPASADSAGRRVASTSASLLAQHRHMRRRRVSREKVRSSL